MKSEYIVHIESQLLKTRTPLMYLDIAIYRFYNCTIITSAHFMDSMEYHSMWIALFLAAEAGEI
jgi:hypothetical protein